MSAATGTMSQPHSDGVGERQELARYRVPAGERILVGQRVDGVVRLTDVPAEPGGRCYLVERELELDGYAALQALLADYLAQAQVLGAVPMATSLARSEAELGGSDWP